MIDAKLVSEVSAAVHANLSDLRRDTNEILKSLKRSSIPGAINWADLKVVDVFWKVNLEGEANYTVLVDEVSPEATEFQTAISEALAKLGWTGVEVYTEW